MLLVIHNEIIFDKMLMRIGVLGKVSQIIQSGSGILLKNLFPSKNSDKSPLLSSQVDCETVTGEFEIANALNFFFVT